MIKILQRNLFLYFFLFTLIGTIQSVKAQSTSNSGTNFWVGYTAHIDGTNSQMSLYLTSNVNTTATVSIPKLGISNTYNIIANSVTIAPISKSAYVGSSEAIENKGIQVVSEQPIVVYAHIYASARSAATLVLPTNTLGKEYFASSYTQDVANQYSEFMVIGTEDNTVVEITPKATTRMGRPANVPFQVTLNKGEVYQVQSSKDLTGSKIISVSESGPSCKKIAVFSGNTFAGIGCTNASSKDNLYQQLYPLSTWGRNFITAPFKTRLGGDVFRVMAAYNNTSVTINGSSIAINSGQFYEFTSATANFVTADKPITLAQYARTQNCDNVTGDPEMILINPIEQTLEDITLYSSPFFQITGHYINIVMKTVDAPDFRLDGSPVSFTPVSANPIYSYAQVTVSAGNHRLTAPAGFNAIAYGFGNVESYGYSAGANIKSLEQYISADQNTFCGPGTVNFKANLTYTPTSLKWYFSDNTTSTETNPTKTFTNPGKYKASLVTTKPNNIDCESKDSTSFEIVINPIITANAGPDLVLCSGDKVTIGQTAVAGITYTWSGTTGLSATNIANPTFQLVNTGTTNITQKLYLDAVNTATKCAARDSVTITIKPALTRDAGPDVTICSSDKATIGLPTLSGYTYSWSPATGLTNASGAQTTVQLTNTTGTVVRNQYIRLATFNNCTVSDTVIVTVKPAPIAQAGSNKSICSGATVSIGAQSQANHTYVWSPAIGLSSTTVSNPTVTLTNTTQLPVSYTYTLTATLDGCVATSQVVVTVNPLPLADAGLDVTICAGSSTTLIATGGTSYSWSPAAGLSATNIAKPVASPTATTTYTVTVTDANGCVNIDQVVVKVNPLPIANAGPDVAICAGSSTTLTASGGTSYSWSPAAGLSATNIAKPVASPTATTTYTVTVTDANGCVNTDQVVVTVNPLPLANAGPDVAICAGSSTTLTASGGTSYSWSPAAGLSATNIAKPVASPTATTTYTVTVTDANGCVNTDQVVVTVNPLPLADAGPDVTICAGSSTTLTASGGTSYSWSPAAGLSATNIAKPVASPTATTTYTVTVTDANGCVNTDQVVVTVNPLPIASITASGVTTFCSGENVTLTATEGASYKWSNGLTSKSIIVTTSGNYTVTVTDVKGCSATSAAVPVTVKPLPVSDAGADVTICSGSSAAIGKSAVTGYTYSWSPATGLSSATAANPTVTLTNLTLAPVNHTYTVTTTLNGCTTTDQVIVKVNPLPLANAGPDVSICIGSSTVLSASGGVTYAWSPASGLSATNIAKPVAKPTITTTYTVTVTDVNGCVKTDEVVVTVNPLPSAKIIGSPSVCPNITGVNYQIETPQDFTFKWGVKGGQIATNANSNITVNWGESNANALVYAVPTSKFGCVGDTVKFKVVINQLLTPETPKGPELLCRQDKNNVEYKVQLTNGSVYTWNIIGGQVVSGQGTNQVKVNWNDIGKGKLWINEASITSSDRCFGTSDTLFFKLIPNTTALAITSVGTELANEKNILVKYNIATRDTYPAGKTFDLQRKLSTDITWTTIAAVPLTSSQFVDANLQTNQSKFEYRLTGKNTCDSVLVSSVHTSILLSGQSKEGQGSNIQVQWNAYKGWAQEPVRYEVWKKIDNATAYQLDQSINSTASNVNLTLPVEGFTQCYRIKAVAGNKESWSNIICFDLENALFIPNIITPNGDGKNDQFEITNLQFYPGSQLKIFNRWGKEVYSTNDYRGDWDAKNLQEGIYYYQLNTKVKARMLKGWVEVVR